MNVALCQLDIVWENKAANFERVESLLQASPVPAGSLFILPEMFSTGFSANTAATIEKPEGPTGKFLSALAKKHNFYVFGAQTTQGSNGKGRNEAVIFDPNGKEIARYCKLQPFSGAGETSHHEPGERTVQVPLNGWTLSPFVCYDLRFPELFREVARKGTNLIVDIANWPYPRDAHWVTLLQARAIENLSYVIGVNRAGSDPGFKYFGRSMVVDPQGVIVADAGSDEKILQATIDLKTVTAWREKFPPLRDIRADYLPPVR
jgi:omega-amidase